MTIMITDPVQFSVALRPSTETIRTIREGKPGTCSHFDFQTAPELWQLTQPFLCIEVFVWG